jgi:hypothetical protein
MILKIFFAKKFPENIGVFLIKLQLCSFSKKSITTLANFCAENWQNRRKILIITSTPGHIRILHENERRFACDLCPRRFGERNALTEHKKNVHEEQKCELCEVIFDNARELK